MLAVVPCLTLTDKPFLRLQEPGLLKTGQGFLQQVQEIFPMGSFLTQER